MVILILLTAPQRGLHGASTYTEHLTPPRTTAAHRDWPNAAIVSIDELEDQSPTGPPSVIAAESHHLTPDTAKILARLASVGRHVLLMTDQPLPDDVASWLPADTVLVIGQEPDRPPRVTSDHERNGNKSS